MRHLIDLSHERAACFNIFGEDHCANILLDAITAKLLLGSPEGRKPDDKR
jgi:hypothetical protein